METWQQREQHRFTAGLYTPPPWKDEVWYAGRSQLQTLPNDHPDNGGHTYRTEDQDTCSEILPPGEFVCTRERNHRGPHVAHYNREAVCNCVWESAVVDPTSLASQHFVFLSHKTPGCIAYTPNDEYGNRDRQIICSPAKYLLKFCPNITQKQIDDYTSRVRAASAIEHYSLTTDANTIEQVYRHGPSSCMSGDKMDHILIHPARMYAACDLAIAYLFNTAGHIRSRAVVWPEKKRRTTVYGDKSLVLMLQDDGYTFGELTGAQIHTAYDIYEKLYICPYVDGADTADFVSEDRLSLWAESQGEWCCKNSDRVGYLCPTEQNIDDDENEDDAGDDEE